MIQEKVLCDIPFERLDYSGRAQKQMYYDLRTVNSLRDTNEASSGTVSGKRVCTLIVRSRVVIRLCLEGFSVAEERRERGELIR